MILLPSRHGGTAPSWRGGTAPSWHGITAPSWHWITAPSWHGGTAPSWRGGTAPSWHGITAPSRRGGTAPSWRGGTAPSWRGGTAPSWHGGTVKSAQRAIHLKLRHPAMHALCEIRVPLTNMSIFTALRTATAKRNCLRRLGNATGYTGRTGIQILCIRSENQLWQTAFALTRTKIVGTASTWPISVGAWHTGVVGLISQSLKLKWT